MAAVINYSARDGKLFATNNEAKAHDQTLDIDAVLMLTTVHIDGMFAGRDKGSIALRDAFIRVAGRLNAAKPADQRRTRAKKATGGETAVESATDTGVGGTGASEAGSGQGEGVTVEAGGEESGEAGEGDGDGEGDEVVDGGEFDAATAPATRYFHHPESGSLFTTEDGSNGVGETGDGALVVEVDADRYAALLAEGAVEAVDDAPGHTDLMVSPEAIAAEPGPVEVEAEPEVSASMQLRPSIRAPRRRTAAAEASA